MGKQAAEKDQFSNEFLDEANVLIEIKVSDDEGETWHRRKISMVSSLDESGLLAGEIFQFSGEKYTVLNGEDGLMAKPLKLRDESKNKEARSPDKSYGLPTTNTPAIGNICNAIILYFSLLPQGAKL